MNNLKTKVIETAMSRLKDNVCNRYGNVLSTEHENALHKIISHMATMAMDPSYRGRLAFPLFAGGGKTQSIVALIYAIDKLNFRNTSVAVCASRVEALCDLKRDLIENGVDPDRIGLVHSYKYDPDMVQKCLEGATWLSDGFASEPSTPEAERSSKQFLLVTHQAMKSKDGSTRINRYETMGLAQERDLIVWDESLVKSEAHSVRYHLIYSALSFFNRFMGSSQVGQETFDFFDECFKIFEGEAARQREARERGLPVEPRLLNLPRRTPDQIERYRLACLQNGNRQHGTELMDIFRGLRGLLDISQFELRLLDGASSAGGIISFSVRVPEDLNNIVVLDASHNIRELLEIDASFTMVDTDCLDVVSYENVEVFQVKHGGGRQSIEDALLDKDGLMIAELVDIIQGIPQDEGVIVFTFIPRAVNTSKRGGGRAVDPVVWTA